MPGNEFKHETTHYPGVGDYIYRIDQLMAGDCWIFSWPGLHSSLVQTLSHHRPRCACVGDSEPYSPHQGYWPISA
jgi:hypothetical protein